MLFNIFLYIHHPKPNSRAPCSCTQSACCFLVGFWFVSLVWGIVCSLPHSLGTTSPSPGNTSSLVMGGIVFLLGLVTETKADFQKWSFKMKNPGQFCNVGLWSISQHPNFFGNLLLWAGLLIINSDSLIQRSMREGELDNRNILSMFWRARRLMVALLSPLFMWTLFSGQASGTITNAVELANQRYGKDPLFQEYIKNVPKIVPSVRLWMKELFVG